ncbi:MAG TPA: sigma-70 family RNA polymerase sigma factor, partial [Polyangia bacterium]
MDRVTSLGDDELRAHMMWLRRLAARLVSPAGADDAVQATLLAAVEHPPSLDRDLRPWLARVLANFAHDARRSETRRRVREAAVMELGAADAATADQLLERHESAQVIARLVSRLREPHRTLVLLRYAEGIAPVDIARSRGLPEGTVRRQLTEAVDQLRAGVAEHYGADRRDWRRALVPLVGVGPLGTGKPWKGALWMTVKTKTGLAAAAVVVLVLLASWTRGRATDEPAAAANGPVANDRRAAADNAARDTRAQGMPASTGLPSAGAPPPQFAAVAVTDPPDCEKKLGSLRTVASARGDVSPETFAIAKPSPATDQMARPLIDGILASVPEKPAFQLECRVSVCRVAAVIDGESVDVPPAWLRAIEQSPAFGRVRGENRGARVMSTRTRDALTGNAVVQHLVYFTMPVVAGEEHPLETRADAATCGERLIALERALDDERARLSRIQAEDSARRRRFETTPTNVELTRR